MMIGRGAPRCLLILCAIALTIIPASAGGAQAAYRTSVPANGATVATAPAQVVITFIEATSVTDSSGSVRDTKGSMVSTGWSVDPNDRTKITVALMPKLGNGVYTVAYTSSSDDGQVTNGAFIFTVAPSTANGTTSVMANSGGARWGFLVAIAIGVAAFIIGELFIVVRSRRDYLAKAARKASRPPDDDG